MPLSFACLMTGLSFSRSDGLTMIALKPCEMRLRRSAICSVGPPLRLATTTLLTLPLASASALTEQIISSRQPLPTRLLLTPTTHFFSRRHHPRRRCCSRRTRPASAPTTRRSPARRPCECPIRPSVPPPPHLGFPPRAEAGQRALAGARLCS